MNAMKHQHHTTHPAILKDAFGSAKIGEFFVKVCACVWTFSIWISFVFVGHVNGVNVIGLSLQGPSVPGLAVMKPCAPQGKFSKTQRNIKNF